MNQWLLEVLPGVFVGRISARVRDYLWHALRDALEGAEDDPYAAVIRQSSENEQGYEIETVGSHNYHIERHLGVLLVQRHHSPRDTGDPLEGLPDPTW